MFGPPWDPRLQASMFATGYWFWLQEHGYATTLYGERSMVTMGGRPAVRAPWSTALKFPGHEDGGDATP